MIYRTSFKGLSGTCPFARILSLLLMLGVMLLGAVPVQAQAPSLFNWGAFQHFWNKNALPGTELKDSIKVEDGYMVDLGFSASVTAVVDRGMVHSVRIQYRAVPGQETGGPRFLKCSETAIRVGTFGWPPERVAAVRKTFEFMTPELKTYQWKNSRFSRLQNSVDTWVFSLEFVDDEAE